MFQAEFNALLQGIKKAFKYKMGEVVWNTPDRELLTSLYTNIYHFAAAKNYHELSDLRDALIDGERIRSFDEFNKEATSIIGKYNRTWLRTEYNQAIAAGQAAARWQDFQRNADDMPYLQYQAIMDSNTREEHAALHGVIKKITDPFWNSYYPPNGWGCRCEAIQMPGSNYKETPDKKITLPSVPPMFRVNFGKEGLAFPDGHAYFKRIPKQYEKEVLARGRSEVRRIIRNADLYVANYHKNPDYTDCHFNWLNGGMKATHKGHSFDPNKGHYEKAAQDVGFKNGHSVILEKEGSDKIGERFAEGLWNGERFEIAGKENVNPKNTREGLKHAAKKNADIAVLYYVNDFNKELFEKGLAMYNGLHKDPKQYKKFKEIICIAGDDIVYKKSHL